MHDPSMGQELMHISTGIFNFGHFPQLHLNKVQGPHRSPELQSIPQEDASTQA